MWRRSTRKRKEKRGEREGGRETKMLGHFQKHLVMAVR
jgi:hypothetical protein